MSQGRMTHPADFEIFLGTQPGLEDLLLREVIERGFKQARTVGGGVTIQGNWSDVWRANLTLRGASKVLARIGEFRAFHLAQLDKRSRKFPWAETLTAGHSVKVEVVTNRKSKIYHAGAAIERLERAIHEEFGARIAESMEDADILIKTRIDDNNVRLSVDTSGVGLHKRGYKQAMGKAPLRETMAALALRGCGYDGRETVIDPMCGSGTFLIEAAEMSRKQRFYGSDRNVNVIGFSKANAERAGVFKMCTFEPLPLSKIERPEGPPGLVIVNPPYGARIGKKKDLFALYSTFGDVMRDRFRGWRVGMITSDTKLAEVTKLPWKNTGPPIAHGGLKVRLFRTPAL